MGETALPFILNDLRTHLGDPDYWFIALAAITGKDPVPEDAYGNTVRMAEAWLNYAEENAW